MKPSVRLITSVVILASGLSGCAIVQSKPAQDGATPDGIPYFMPRRPFIVTVTKPAGGGNATVTLSQGTAEPDLKHRFIISAGSNLLAKNQFNISATLGGVLISSASTATSEVAAAVQNAASSAVALGGVPIPLAANTAAFSDVINNNLLGALSQLPQQPIAPVPPPPPPPATHPQVTLGCPLAGTSYQYLIYPEHGPDAAKLETDPMFCGYTVHWKLHGMTTNSVSDTETAATTSWVSGIFFKHELPYLVEVRSPPDSNGMIPINRTVLTSPDESEINFFPINHSFFADNTASITLTDGVITGVNQTKDGELTAAVGLPAAFVGSYTSAIGQLLTGLTTNSADQQKLIAQIQSTSATQLQSAAVAQAEAVVCRKTVASYNFATMNAVQAAAAATAIQTACGGSSSTK